MVSGFQAFIDSIFNPIFGWLLNIPPIVAIIILATVLALISTLLQKVLTDQARLKRLREDTKKMQAELKLASKEGDSAKVMKLQGKMMPMQLDMMKESFKPLLYTLIPFLLVFFWLSNHFAFHEIQPNQPFVVSATFEEGIGGTAILTSPQLKIEEPVQTIQQQNDEPGIAKWIATGPAGEHSMVLSLGPINVTRQVLITEERNYEQPEKALRGSISSFNVENEKLIPIPGFSLFGWHPGWIFYYIVLSIPLSLLLKKLLNVV
jgi:uncharacterized membrane protein (DUF106 family)